MLKNKISKSQSITSKQFWGNFKLFKTGTTVWADSYMNEERYLVDYISLSTERKSLYLFLLVGHRNHLIM